MAVMRGAPQRANNTNWLQEAKQTALELRTSAHSVAHNLFRSGDLRPFMDLLSRMHYYDAYNLLLIYQQYPNATCLAGFKVWQKQLGDPNAQVLRPEWRGKGIDLIAPYTDFFGGGKYTLTWFAVKQFDISQTNIENYTPPPPTFLQDPNRHTHLFEAISQVISTQYHRSVIPVSGAAQLRSAGLPGQMNDYTITVRDDIKPEVRINFLCDCLCRLSMDAPNYLTPLQKDTAIQYITYCLFRIWGINTPRPLVQNKVILASVPYDMQVNYLSLIQRTVRLLDESVSLLYLSNHAAGEGRG